MRWRSLPPVNIPEHPDRGHLYAAAEHVRLQSGPSPHIVGKSPGTRQPIGPARLTNRPQADAAVAAVTVQSCAFRK